MRLDQGWLSGEIFSKTHLLLGIEWYNQARYDEARTLLLPNTTLNRDDPVLQAQIAESFRYLSLIQQQQGDQAGAVESLQQARAIKADDPRVQFQYGRALYGLDPQRVAEVEQAFSSALALRPAEPAMWQAVIGFWRQVGETERADTLCRQATAPELVTALSDSCASP